VTETNVTVTLPTLGEGVEEATISRWLVSPGDPIDFDAPLVEVATDKVDSEIPSPCTGVLLEILVDENQTVPVGTVLATIAVDAPQVTPAPPATEPAPRARAAPTPAAVELVAEAAPVPLASSGEGITSASPPAPPVPSPSEDTTTSVERLPRIRQIIAGRMMESLHNSAQLTTVVEVDVTPVAALRDEHKARFDQVTGTKLSFLPFFAKAAIEALHAHPVLAATINSDCTEATYHHYVNLGIAVDGPKGLMVPVIQHADRLTIIDIAAAITNLAGQVRAGTIAPDALVGGTFTITNTGSRGALFDTPILNQPQSGILGTGAVVERVVPWRDPHGALGIAVRSQAYLSVTYDHRIVDGADAARFLTTIKTRLEGGFSAEELFATRAPAHAGEAAEVM
jgi:2-oxoglutarate dehydrogenase E2 component (dihydrolipoamide succinyltransferase)